MALSHSGEDEPLLKMRNELLKINALHTTGNVSFLGAVLVLFCTAVGAGIVAIPRAFSFAGWAVGTLVLLVSAALTCLSLSCLFKCAQLQGRPSTYQSLVHKYLPSALSLFVETATAVLLLGTIGTMLLLSMHVWQSVESAMGVAPFSQSHMPWALLVVAFMLCLPRSFQDLQWVTKANICCSMSVVLMISIESVNIIRSSPAKTSVAAGFSPATLLSGTPSALPIMLFTFFCQFQAPSLYTEMQPSCQRKFSLIGAVAVAGVFSMYMCIGLLGYAAFGANMEADVLAQLRKAIPSNYLLCFGHVPFGIVLLLSTPLVISPLRSMCFRRLAKDSENMVEADDISFGSHVAVTGGILVTALMISLNVPGVDFIMGFLGATCVVFLALIVPGLLTINCCEDRWKLGGTLLLTAGVCFMPLTIGVFVAKHLGYLPH